MDRVVLVIEDEQNIANLVRIALEHGGFRASVARTGEEGLAYLAHSPADLAIVDIGLPGIDGLEVCRRIRATSDLPIIILTARGDETDRVVGLELGADDYVPKPFSPRELVARVKAVLRRTRPARPLGDRLEVGDLLLSRSLHEASLAGRRLDLSLTEFHLLGFLMEHAGAALTREVLLDRVWGLAFPGGTRTVDQHIAQLRTKLGRPDLIETVRGVGYRLVKR